MLPIGTIAKKLHDLSKGKYVYKMLPDPCSGKTMLENKDDSIVDLLDTMLTKWEEGESGPLPLVIPRPRSTSLGSTLPFDT